MQKPVNDAQPPEQKTVPTARIQAWSQLIKAITPYIWAAVILVVIVPLLGKTFIAAGTPSEVDTPMAVIDRPLQPQLDGAIASAVQAAHAQAEHYASQELDRWVSELITRVDRRFLPWYFDYFNQKQIEFSAPFIWLSSAVRHSLDQNSASPGEAVAERLTETFQAEFAKRVLRPQIAQLELERITRETINVYVSELSSEIAQIQSSYSIPQGQWERYLGDIAITINDTEDPDLSLKLLAGGSTYLVAKAMLPIATKVGSKVAAAFAGKASAKMAAKTGSTVATKLGGQFLDPIVAVGIIVWDLWDYRHTVKIEQPLLREALLDYLEEVKASLLDNHQNSIMSAIYQLEASVQSANAS